MFYRLEYTVLENLSNWQIFWLDRCIVRLPLRDRNFLSPSDIIRDFRSITLGSYEIKLIQGDTQFYARHLRKSRSIFSFIYNIFFFNTSQFKSVTHTRITASLHFHRCGLCVSRRKNGETRRDDAAGLRLSPDALGVVGKIKRARW